MRFDRRSLFPLLTALSLTILATSTACSTAPDDAAGEDAESALRALRSNEIVGTLAFGETSAPVDYTDAPLYRALRVDAAAGDTIDAWVRSTTGGDARAWLLSPTFATMTSNNDGDSTTRDAHVKRKVMKAGSYFVAFRDANREDNTFTVSLAPSQGSSGGGTGGGNGDAGVDSGHDAGGGTTGVDPFDDALLSGAPISSNDARGFFAPGASTAALGGFAMAQRTRTCNATTGCTTWVRNDGVTFAYSTYELWYPGPGWSNQKSCFQFKSETFTAVEGAMSLTVDGAGKFSVALASTATGNVSCANVTAGSSSCGTFSTAGASPTGGQSCNLPNPAGGGADGTVYPATVPLFDTSHASGSPLAMRLVVTHDYVYGRSTTKSAPDSTGTSREIEYALYGTMQPGTKPTFSGGGSACKPTSCAAQGKNCGTISDGCGGTISCGGCDYPYTCGSDNKCQVPPNCNLQPCYAGATVAYTCCGSGQVTCSNGHGCTCYDACF